MFHAEAVDRRREVVSDFLLLGVEPDALPDDCGFGTGAAPYCERHLEAHGQDALGLELAGARAESVAFAAGLVERLDAFEVWRDVASHVEALHDGWWRPCGRSDALST